MDLLLVYKPVTMAIVLISAGMVLASSRLFRVSRTDNEPMEATEQQHLATSIDFERNMWNSICQQFKVLAPEPISHIPNEVGHE